MINAPFVNKVDWFSLQTNTTLVQENNKTNSTAESKSGGTIWQGAKFGGDQDGKMTAKFQRLMGIKNTSTTGKV